MDEWWKLFTPRQLVALTTFSGLLGEVAEQVRSDASAAGSATVIEQAGGAGGRKQVSPGPPASTSQCI